MAVKFFGQFLVEKGAISAEALLAAVELQEVTNLKFGEQALRMGLLSEAEVERVHDAQRGEDCRFGDMAVKLGLLGESQMQEVLTRQKNSHLYLGEALVQVGALSEEGLAPLLEAFKKDQAPYLTDGVTVPEGVALGEVWAMTADLTLKMLVRVVELSLRPAPARLVRELPLGEVVASMSFSGSVRGRYLLGVTPAVREAIARALLKEENVSEEPPEVLDDTVMEFVNIVCGNVAAKAAQLGKTLEIAPPELIRPAAPIPVPAGQQGLLFPVLLAGGEQIALGLIYTT